MKQIAKNLNIFKQSTKKAIGFLFTTLSCMLLFITKEELGIDSICKSMFIIIGFFIISILYGIIKTFTYKEKVLFEQNNSKLTVRYGDLLKIAFSNNPLKNKKKKIVVISVNTAFDTIVDETTSNIDKPLVSPNSIHGQWIKMMNHHNITCEKIHEKIKGNLKIQKLMPKETLETTQKTRGNLDIYPKGTIAVLENKNTIFYLLALADFDENNKANNTKTELKTTIEALIDYYDKKGQGYDMYLPLLGTGLSRTDISPEEALDIIVSEFKLNKKKIQGNINIVIYNGSRDKISIDI